MPTYKVGSQLPAVMAQTKELWIQVRYLAQLQNTHFANGDVACVSIPSGATTQQLKTQVLRQLCLDQFVDSPDHRFVIKLRDADGALLPFSNQLRANPVDRPFALEVVGVHQNVGTNLAAVPTLHVENLHSRIQQLNERVEDLETRMETFSVDFDQKLGEELRNIAEQSTILKRFVKQEMTNP